MKLYAKLCSLILLAGLASVPGLAIGQTKDSFGTADKITIEVAPSMEPGKWIAGVYLQNDEDLAAITIPLRYGEFFGQYSFDSAVFLETRVANFALKITNDPDTTNAVQVGLLYALGGNQPPLGPGLGPVAWLYFTQLDTSHGVAAPKIDTTFFPPYNHLQLVTLDAESITPLFESVVSEKLTTFENIGTKSRR